LFPDLSWSEVDVAAPAGPDIHAGELAADETFTDRSRHVALFYQGPRQYLPALSSVVAAARKRGDALFIAVPAHKVPLVRGMLRAGSANVTMADMTELGRNPARIIPALLTYAGEHRGQRVCCIAEPAWPGRTAAELLEAAKHEALVNLAFQDSPVTIICPYDTEGLPAAVIDDAVSTHPVFIENRQERASARYLGPDLPSRCTGALPRPPADAEALATATTCIRCAASSPAGPNGPGLPRTVSTTWSSRSANSPLTRCITPAAAGRCRSGGPEKRSSARSPTRARSPIRWPGTGSPRMTC
jgi:DcmR-like sensory protein